MMSKPIVAKRKGPAVRKPPLIKKQQPLSARLDALIERCRGLRDDAYCQQMLETAYFWGEKLVSMTNDALDIFSLCKVLYSQQQYLRCEFKLRGLAQTSLWSKSLAAQCLIKLERWEECTTLLAESVSRKPSEEGITVLTQHWT
jgi:Anaphase-promoting complex, cyclosome, subunit 3